MKSNFTREYTVFLEVLVKARKRQKLTQQAIAKFLGKPQSFVSKYENGERRLDIIEFFSIAKALNEEPIQLLHEMQLINKTSTFLE